ncbi:hypothetical protein NL676_038558 [Syzygium grande]|nr:hypothetical protein NL676_038558 [Syzygium grande]
MAHADASALTRFIPLDANASALLEQRSMPPLLDTLRLYLRPSHRLSLCLRLRLGSLCISRRRCLPLADAITLADDDASIHSVILAVSDFALADAFAPTLTHSVPLNANASIPADINTDADASAFAFAFALADTLVDALHLNSLCTFSTPPP